MRDAAPKAPRHYRPIVVIDDNEEEGLWVRKRLLEHGAGIAIIAMQPEAIEYEPNALQLTARLHAARRAIMNREGQAFEEACRELPSVVVLDQYLKADANPADLLTSNRASLEVCKLVNDIWSEAQKEPAFRDRGWNLRILIYTGQTRRMLSGMADYVSTARPWFALSCKPPGIPLCTPEVAARQGQLLAAEINALMRADMHRADVDVVHELYAGAQGGLLQDAMRVATSSEAPVWFHGRWWDGCEKLAPLLVDCDPVEPPQRVDNEEDLHAALRRLRSGLATHPVFEYSAGIADPHRFAATCKHVRRKFAIVSPRPLRPELLPLFTTVEVVPLHDWSEADLQELFDVGRKVVLDRAIATWLKEQQFDYAQFSTLFLPEGEQVSIEALKQRVKGLENERTTITVSADQRHAFMRWENKPHDMRLNVNPGITTLAVLLAIANKSESRDLTLTARDLVHAMKRFRSEKVRRWAEKMEKSDILSTAGSSPRTRGEQPLRKFRERCVNAAGKELEAIFGCSCIKAEGYGNPELEFLVTWVRPGSIKLSTDRLP